MQLFPGPKSSTRQEPSVFLISVFYLPLGLCPNKFYEYTPPSYCCPKRLFLILQACHSRGSRGCHYTPQILTDQFTLPQLQGTDYAHHITIGPPDFQTSYGPAPPTLAEILPIATKKIVTSPQCMQPAHRDVP